MSKAWQNGSSRRWREIRARVLADNLVSNGGACGVALRGVCTGGAECVHHVLGRLVTGDDQKWLVASCKACNAAIGEPAKSSPRPRRISSW